MHSEADIRGLLPEKFCKKITFSEPDNCWNWDCKKGNYPSYFENGKIFRSSRYIQEKLNGFIPDGMLVLHKCDNPNCVNPNHLFLGTHGDNMRDMVLKGRHVNKNTPIERRSGKNSIKISSISPNIRNVILEEQLNLKLKCDCMVSKEKTIIKIIRNWGKIRDFRINGIEVAKMVEEM